MQPYKMRRQVTPRTGLGAKRLGRPRRIGAKYNPAPIYVSSLIGAGQAMGCFFLEDLLDFSSDKGMI